METNKFTNIKIYELNVALTQVRSVFEDVPPALLYDVLHDPEYRRLWDKAMMENVDIARINPCNDIGYYASATSCFFFKYCFV